MRNLLKIAILIILSVATIQAYAEVEFMQGSPSSVFPNMCKKPIQCSPNTIYRTFSDATACGCCACDGGVLGCSGGAKGRVICMDSQTDYNCACQYTMSQD